MTPGNNGASTPEDDDPFGYLYADGQANGAQPPSGGGYGYPNSVNRVRAVGTRQYGQQPQTAPYGQVPQQASYSQPNAHYAAPETLPGGAQTAHHATPAGGGGRGGRGPNTKGLLIGAIAVVAAVVIGIGVAMLGGDKDKDKASDEVGTDPTQSQESKPSPSKSKGGGSKPDLPEADAKTLRLGPGVSTASDFKGSKADGGVYVTGFNHVGAKVTWTVNGIEEAGDYRLYARYSVPGVDANATLLVNGKANTQPMGLKNFINSPKGDWEKGWQTSWAPVTLTKGTNTIELECNEGNQCDAVLDQLWVQ
ncbi:CBM35 domain-containing protein [Streptomyces sp. SID5643]|uniref:CBM35 domain-containing protein n=1 Tax=Streptomyces sp. SID5643 TaxID=2690307 RepID=UPI00136CDBCA|nr:CBM35 domain-containing protein [Streptomyces sp. SID5643]MZF87235.1 carbohydrate-binding protein [Streptomyces sp. SID5643]